MKKVVNWKQPDSKGVYEVFLECMHAVLCHTSVDKYPEHIPNECFCSICEREDDLERKGKLAEL